MVTQTTGDGHSDLWRWSFIPMGGGRGVEPDHGKVNSNTALFMATMFFFLTLYTSVLNIDAAYLLERYITA
jgi:hypothetical protein